MTPLLARGEHRRDTPAAQHVFTLPEFASFTMRGLAGYSFGPLQTDAEVHYIDVGKGHDTFQISKRVARLYYVLSGAGCFVIDNQRYEVEPGMLVEVPPKVEYSYSGTMRLIAFCTPVWFHGNDRTTRWNKDVFEQMVPPRLRRDLLTRLAQKEIFGKSPARFFLRINQRLWNMLPPAITSLRPVHAYGTFLHTLSLRREDRAQSLATFFFRNRPALDLVQRLLGQKATGETLRMAVLGCSTGAEAYSLAWAIRTARPDLDLTLEAMDIAADAVEFARRGVYTDRTSALTGTDLLERMSAAEIDQLFDRTTQGLTIKPWLREGIHWRVGDASDAGTLDALGSQDIVVANNFLCHLAPADAERCLRTIARIVRPGGYLCVRGVDLDIRTRVARDRGWLPVLDLLQEIHDGDPSVRRQWPCHYAGLEPLDRSRPDWRIRYAAVFQLPAASASTRQPAEFSSCTA